MTVTQTSPEVVALRSAVDALVAALPTSTPNPPPPSPASSSSLPSVTDFASPEEAVAQELALYWPPGIHTIHSTLVLRENATWIGAGATLKAVEVGFQGNAVVETEGFHGMVNTDAYGGPRGVRLQGLRIDANGNPRCIQLYAPAYRIDSCDFLAFSECGIYSEWGQGGDPALEMEAYITNFRVGYGLTQPGSVSAGIDFRGPHDSVFSNGTVWTLTGTIDKGIWVHGRPNGLGAVGERFEGVHTWGRINRGWVLEKEGYATNCTAEGAFDANVHLIGNDIRWHGNIFGTDGNNAAQGHPNEVGIRIGDGNPATDRGTNTCDVDAAIHGFRDPGCPLDYRNSWGNRVRMTLRSGGAGVLSQAYKGGIAAHDQLDVWCEDQHGLDLIKDPRT